MQSFEKVQEIFIVADKIKDAIDRIGTAFRVSSLSIWDLWMSFQEGGKIPSVYSFRRDIWKVFEAIVKVLEWAAPIVAKIGSIIENFRVSPTK